jgi:hypothetical protein
MVAKGAQGESCKKISRRATININRHSDSLKKSQLTLAQGMMKKGDVFVVSDDDDDEVRTSS